VQVPYDLTRGSFKAIPASEETTNTQRFEADSLADDAVSGEPVSPCYSLFSPVLFGKTGNFPFLSNDPRSTFFQVLLSFPLVMEFSLRCKNCDHSSAKQGYFIMFQGRLT
jgi:hypothetical protein